MSAVSPNFWTAGGLLCIGNALPWNAAMKVYTPGKKKVWHHLYNFVLSYDEICR